MKQFLVCLLAFFTTVLFQGYSLLPTQSVALQRDLDALAKRGYTYRMLDNDLIELTDPVGGEKQLKSLHEPSEATIRSWAAQRGIPILEIDPNTVDTSQYVGWYNYWQQLPISSDVFQPPVVGDVDDNGNAEIYGLVAVSGPVTTIESRICEVDPPSFRHTYQPYPGIPTGIVDIDNDGLREILFSGQSGLILTDFRQQQQGTLPMTQNFVHQTTSSGVGASFATPVVGNLDADSLTDCLYKVSEVDSSDTTYPLVTKVVVAEYDSQSHNLQRAWAMRLPPKGQPDDAIGHFVSADFDRDGKQEFVTTGGLLGNVFLFESTGDNSYALTYQDSVPFVNLYRSTVGDVDGDGNPEFFVVATEGNGQWALMYEADSDDHYSAKLLFHFLSGGPIDFPTYLTADIDGDGRLELLTTSGANIFIFKSDGDNSYRLWYYKREDRLDAIQVYDFNRDGRMDLVISKDGTDPQGHLYYYSDLYRATPLMTVEERMSMPLKVQLFQSYPNPFNSSTVISYELAETQSVRMMILDLLGREIAVSVNEIQGAGHYSTHWNATGVATGMYFCRLQVGEMSFTNKLLLIR